MYIFQLPYNRIIFELRHHILKYTVLTANKFFHVTYNKSDNPKQAMSMWELNITLGSYNTPRSLKQVDFSMQDSFIIYILSILLENVVQQHFLPFNCKLFFNLIIRTIEQSLFDTKRSCFEKMFMIAA